MDKELDTSQDLMIRVSLSDTSSVSSFVEDNRDHDVSTARSSLNTSIDTPDLTKDDQELYESVNWEELEKTESSAFQLREQNEQAIGLLTRSKEDVNVENDTKIISAVIATRQHRAISIGQIHKIVNEQNSLRESMIPIHPPFTDLEFWAALVADYPKTAAKLPYLLSKKIKGGIPSPIRGLVWQSMAGANDPTLESLFDNLIVEQSPFDKVIGRDLHRTFPEVEMFRERGGKGQVMLGEVLRAFSLYDMQVGYCQGLAFLVGPLLMHLDEHSAFCILVRLMEEYDLRTMFTADMSGLHLRIFQFSELLRKFVPLVWVHLQKLNIQSVYASQWFLSFFAVTCPLNMLLRIYDVIFVEGALETLMRVAIAVMQANEEKILLLKEEDEVLQMLLSRSLWTVYDGCADRLISDAMSLTPAATRSLLEDLEKQYQNQKTIGSDAYAPESPTKSAGTQVSEVQAAASRFLGRIWSNMGSYNAPLNASVPGRVIRRTTSKSSLTSTLNSLDEEGLYVRQSGDMYQNTELHSQIEDLVIALSSLQKQHAVTVEELEAEKRTKDDDRRELKTFISLLPQEHLSQDALNKLLDIKERLCNDEENDHRLITFKALVKQLDAARTEVNSEQEKTQALARDLDSKCGEVRNLKDQLFEIRNRYQDSQREKSKLERTLVEIRQRQQPEDIPSVVTTPEYEYYEPASPTLATFNRTSPTHGLRELRLGKQNQLRTPSYFSKRTSSLILAEDVQAALSYPIPNKPTCPVDSTNDPQCHSCDALRMELAAVKTNEAIARQEYEDIKIKLDQLKRSIGIGSNWGAVSSQSSVKQHSAPETPADSSAWPKIGKFGWSR
ncbi:rab-GTPase-TBC domain-containing protein [Lipomyces japonicus]|uniref:rab-GTPase-TBC domain-containing protein n=1 Tax=Lipomyces japonicus TaxID=56871 RepID=UPI0034CD8090